MPLDVIMPALGMAQDAGKLVAWLKQPGDEVREGDVLFEVETDKATMEVEAQGAGFLTDVSASAGEDVPVGQVIARISETNEPSQTAPAPAPPATEAPSDLPEGREVIMPALGMAQDTGLLVAWQKAPGDAVAADDVLFEVETDKSTMEVPAGVDGYLAATLAEAGEEVPVGRAVAIISDTAPADPVARKWSDSAAPATSAEAKTAPAEKAAEARPAKTPAKAPDAAPAAARSDGRVLASPKARRLALEQGLDLARLVAAGHPQPYHVRDLDVLRSLPDTASAPQGGAPAQARRLTAHLDTEGVTAFAAWAEAESGCRDPLALLAGLAAASLRDEDGAAPIIVAVERFDEVVFYADPDRPELGRTQPDPEAETPTLRLRDLRLSAIDGVEMGGEDVPCLTLTQEGTRLSLTLECPADQMSARGSVRLLSEFAGRMRDPLRHLL